MHWGLQPAAISARPFNISFLQNVLPLWLTSSSAEAQSAARMYVQVRSTCANYLPCFLFSSYFQ